MRCTPPLRLVLIAAALSLSIPLALAAKQTVCTITVNSSDEKEVFRRHLPASKYEFVELVERNRPDWLNSACQAAITCDVLIISGHYDGTNAFFSDRLELQEHLPLDELERVSCSDSCPGLFSQLKEVYLFGCNTLNPIALSSASAEIVRSLVREGHSLKEAERQLRALNAEHGESSRDRMRQVFWDVPVIYGFSSVAPVGPVAASSLDRFFRTNGAGEVGGGRSSGRLLQHFAPFAMSAAQGMTEKDPRADARGDVCQFVDDRLTDTKRLGFVHALLQRETGEARMHLDRIQRYTKLLEDPTRRTPEVNTALATIAADKATRARYLAFARDADKPAVRARMIRVALDLGWLTPEARWTELALMLGELQARSTVSVTELDLACTLNEDGELDGAFNRRVVAGGPQDNVPHAAFRACLGSTEGHARTLHGLVSPHETDVRMAQAYLRHRPITDRSELRGVAAEIVAMPPSEAQVRALESLGRHYVSDRAILDMLVKLYTDTKSSSVQIAVAGILIRADRSSMSSPELVSTLLVERLPAPGGGNMLDALVRQLQSR